MSVVEYNLHKLGKGFIRFVFVCSRGYRREGSRMWKAERCWRVSWDTFRHCSMFQTSSASTPTWAPSTGNWPNRILS